MDLNFELFESFLKAPSKDFINRVILEAFSNKDSEKLPESLISLVAESLEIDKTTSEKLIQELNKLVNKIIFENISELANIQDLFASSSLPANLKTLLSKLLFEKTTFFRQNFINNEGIVPKLIDFDWRVDIKMATNLAGADANTKSGQQTCIIKLKNEENESQSKKQLSSSKPILDILEIVKQQFNKRSKKELGLLSFFARVYSTDKCGSNGLPLIPNSIRIYGRFQFLKSLDNNYLCKYVDIQKGNHERIFVVSEHYNLNFNDLINDAYMYNLVMANSSILIKWTHQALIAFAYLANNSIVHRFISLKNFCITPQGNIKLNNFGLFYMSECGFCVNFPIINTVTLAPECFLLEYVYGNKFNENFTNNNEQNIELNDSKADVWGFGVILFQLLYGLSLESKIDRIEKNEQLIGKYLDLFENYSNDENDENYVGYNFLIDLFKIDNDKKNNVEKRILPILLKIVKKCLTLDHEKRPTFEELIFDFEDHIAKFPDMKSLIEINNKSSLEDTVDHQNHEKEDDYYLWERGIDEIYYLWRLAGGDFLQNLKQNGRLFSQLMPIQKLPIYNSVEDGCIYGKAVSDETLFDDTIVPLSLSQLINRLKTVKLDAYYPIFERDLNNTNINDSYKETRSLTSYSNSFFTDQTKKTNAKIENVKSEIIESTQNQPLNIREVDIEYQLHRIIIFSRYLSYYPFKKDELYKECRVDIPPIYRSKAWVTLLDVKNDIQKVYSQINKEIITQTDRQIDVDIPRCHQYDSLMASPQAHIKLKRVLKAWIISNPDLVYWQGLDSLCAPFLYLNFNNEAIAYGCLKNFVNKYATKFFLKDNSAVIHEYLAVFSHLIAFHDPELADHFESIEFRPDLYAIPWFLTMFAHVFPLHKIFHLWDTLLLGSSSMPLCIGISILKQLRKILLNSDFNECILLFSELPEINIAKCVSDSIDIFCSTPDSCMYREHSSKKTNNLIEQIDNLDLTSIPLDMMRSQLCPRISPRDLIKLHETKSSQLLLIDIRPANEFQEFSLAASTNIPFESIDINKLMQNQLSNITNDSNDPIIQLLYVLQQNKNQLKIFYGSASSRLENLIELCNTLVRLKFSKICFLQSGIESLRSTKISLNSKN